MLPPFFLPSLQIFIMCGRFQLSVSGSQITERFNVEVFNERFTPRYNCAPSQNLPVITNNQPETIQFYRWGLIPFWAKDAKIGIRLINARAESVMEKPSFKIAFIRMRCLIPANGFYEWEKGKKKIAHRFYLPNDELFAMAGLWDQWKDADGKTVRSFTIITTKPNSLVKTVHDRMPVILPKNYEKIWLEENNPNVLKALLKPFPSEEMKGYPVSKRINTPLNDDPDIIRPDRNQMKLF